jgi:hypothetical protein
MKLARLAAYSAAALCFGLSTFHHSDSQAASAVTAVPGPPSDSGPRIALRAQKGQTRQQMFDQLDTNHDGVISRSEAEANPDLIVIFIKTDTNQDGVLSATEFALVPIVGEDGSAIGGTTGTGAGGTSR